MEKLRIYVASPYGFSEAGQFFYYGKLIPMIEAVGFEVLDPWKLTDDRLIKRALHAPEGMTRRTEWTKVNVIIGQNNDAAIVRSHLVLGIFDGTDVDSGTASEITRASTLDIAVEGYRGDFRLSSDNSGAIVNLQVEHYVRIGGGVISLSLKDLEARLRLRHSQLLALL